MHAQLDAKDGKSAEQTKESDAKHEHHADADCVAARPSRQSQLDGKQGPEDVEGQPDVAIADSFPEEALDRQPEHFLHEHLRVLHPEHDHAHWVEFLLSVFVDDHDLALERTTSLPLFVVRHERAALLDL